MKKVLSIIIPCFNHGKYISETLDSIKESDTKNVCEIIIINDGSTDAYTLEVLNTISDPNIRIINQENQGLAGARNKGIVESKCEYLLMLDSDNKITTDFIDTFLALQAEGQEFDMLHGDALFFDERQGLFKSGPLEIFKIFRSNYIDACSIIRKESLIELGKYDDQMPYMGWEDWDLWIRMALNNKRTIYSEKIFFHYRYSSDSMIRVIGHKEEETKQYLIKKYKNQLLDFFYLDQILTNIVEKNIDKIGIKKTIQILNQKIMSRIFKRKSIPIKIDKLWL